MTANPTRWRWGGLVSRLTGDTGSDAPAGAGSYVLRPAAAVASWEQAATNGVLTWHGGKSAAARMTIRLIEAGDEVLLLNDDRRRAIVGVARVVAAAYPAPGPDELSRLAIDIELLRRVLPVISLSQLRTDARLHDCPLLRAPTPELVRLSSDYRRILRRLGVD
jgi:predicted RNA-binding protein with PUA-like domain